VVVAKVPGKVVRVVVERDCADAQVKLGGIYQHGVWIGRDMIQCLHWWQLAFNHRHPEAYWLLGRLFRYGFDNGRLGGCDDGGGEDDDGDGDGDAATPSSTPKKKTDSSNSKPLTKTRVQRDLHQAVHYFEQGCHARDTRCMLALAQMMFKGEGVDNPDNPQNIVRAQQLLVQALDTTVDTHLHQHRSIRHSSSGGGGSSGDGGVCGGGGGGCDDDDDVTAAQAAKEIKHLKSKKWFRQGAFSNDEMEDMRRYVAAETAKSRTRDAAETDSQNAKKQTMTSRVLSSARPKTPPMSQQDEQFMLVCHTMLREVEKVAALSARQAQKKKRQQQQQLQQQRGK
jgi:TPR repeat protein